MPHPIYTSDVVAQARFVVTSFHTMVADFGLTEARELIDTAWSILRTDHAARRTACWIGNGPRDAA